MAIRQPPSSIKDANLRGFLQELRNAIGKTGEQVNQVAMRVRQITNTPPPPPEPPVTPEPPPPQPPGGDGLPPKAPLTLTTTSDAWAIRLNWTQPSDLAADYDVTEIWCLDPDDTGAGKKFVGELRGNQYVFTGLSGALLKSDSTWYFWVRNRDIENLTSVFTPDDETGVMGKSLPSPEDLINEQVIDITEGPLYNWLGRVIQLLRGPTSVPDSVAERLKAQEDKLVAIINEVTVSGNGTLDPSKIWYFDANAESWTGSSATVTWASGAITAEATANNGELISPVLATPIDGSKYPAIRVRSQQLAGTEWVKGLKFRASGGTSWHTYTPPSPPLNGPTYTESGYSDTDWDLSTVTNWTGNNIAQLAFVLEESGQEVQFDWIAIGRIAPGASWESVEAVRVSSNRVIRKPYTDFTPGYGPPNPYNGVALRVDDLWYDTATAEYDANTGLLLKGGNRPHGWTGSAWAPLNDSRIIHSEAELWNIAKAQAGANGSAAYRISGISAKANDAFTLAGTKASITDVDNAFAGTKDSLTTRLSYLETQSTDGTTAAIADFQKAAIGYATVATAHTYLGVTYRVGDIFEGNGSTIIYPALTYPDADYPQYAATDRKTVIDSVGVTRWNTIVGMTNPAAVKWNTGLPLAKAVKQVSVTPAAFCVINGEVDDTKTTQSACVLAGGTWNPAGSPLGVEQQFQALQKADGELYGQYSVKIDNKGWVSGFGLSSETAQDGSPRSEFGIRADRFWIAAPASPNLPDIGVVLAALTANAGTNAVIYYVTGRLTSAPGTARLYAYFQPAAAHGLGVGDWFTLKNIRATATTTSDNYHTRYNESFRVAGLQNAVYVGNSGSTTENLYVNPDQFAILFEVDFQSVGYRTSQTTGPFSDPPKLVQQKYLPFIVTTTQRTIDGVPVPAGVYITDAYIRNATITNAKIADAAVTIQKMSGPIYSDDFLSSGGNPTNPVATPGTLGWCITRTGDAVFNTVIARTKNIEANGVTASGGYSNTANPPLRRTASQGEFLFWSPSQLAVTYGRGNIAFTATISSYVFAGTNATQPMTPAIRVYRDNVLVRQIPFTSKTLSGPLTMTVTYLDTTKSNAATIYEFKLVASITTVAADAYVDLNSIDEFWVEYKR